MIICISSLVLLYIPLLICECVCQLFIYILLFSTLQGDSRLRNIESCCYFTVLSFSSEDQVLLCYVIQIREQNFVFCLAVNLFKSDVDVKGISNGLSTHNSESRATRCCYFTCVFNFSGIAPYDVLGKSKRKPTLKSLCKQNRMLG